MPVSRTSKRNRLTGALALEVPHLHADLALFRELDGVGGQIDHTQEEHQLLTGTTHNSVYRPERKNIEPNQSGAGFMILPDA